MLSMRVVLRAVPVSSSLAHDGDDFVSNQMLSIMMASAITDTDDTAGKAPTSSSCQASTTPATVSDSNDSSATSYSYSDSSSCSDNSSPSWD